MQPLFAMTGILLALMALAFPVPAQGPPAGTPPEVTRAQAQLSAGHVDSTIATLEDFFRRTPNAIAGRLLLGNAYRQKGDLDKALAAYALVRQPRPSRLQAVFAVAAIHAGRNRIDEALDSLRVLKQTGAFDMDLAQTSPGFEKLLGDPRAASVMFQPADFANPFVEPVKIIHEWVGETKGDQFSWIARGIGDVDGDRVSDIVTSAPSFGANGQPGGPGKVYVYSGESGKLLWTQTGSPNERLGTGLEGAGDVDGDGAGDVVAGALGAGKAYVYSGRDGRVLFALTGESPNDGFGQSASAAGDVNGDGRADVIIGAPGANTNGQGAGRAYVFSGKDGARLLTLGGEAAGDAYGRSVSAQMGGQRAPIHFGARGACASGTGP